MCVSHLGHRTIRHSHTPPKAQLFARLVVRHRFSRKLSLNFSLSTTDFNNLGQTQTFKIQKRTFHGDRHNEAVKEVWLQKLNKCIMNRLLEIFAPIGPHVKGNEKVV